MKLSARGISIAMEPDRPLPRNEIIWGSQDGGCSRFPGSRTLIEDRLRSGNPAPMKEFGRAVSSAVDKVWIVDEYFLSPDKGAALESRIYQIIEWIPVSIEACDIKILTKEHREIGQDQLDLFQIHADEVNRASARRNKKFSIEVRMHLTKKFDCLHDRFAVIDDELWHFGATVGGFHAKVSAASRGWRASDHGAIDFFRMAWEAGE